MRLRPVINVESVDNQIRKMVHDQRMESQVSYVLAGGPGYTDVSVDNIVDVDMYGKGGTFDKVGTSPVWNVMEGSGKISTELYNIR